MLLRNWILVGVAWVVLYSLSSLSGNASAPAVAMIVAVNVLMFLLLLRFGFLATVITIFILAWLESMPATFHASAWYSRTGFAGLLVLLALAFYGFRIAIGGRPILDSIAYEE